MRLPTVQPNRPFFANNFALQRWESRANLRATLETTAAQTRAATAGIEATARTVATAAGFGMAVIDNVQKMRDAWESTRLEAAKVAAVRDMNDFNLQLLKNRDYTTWPDAWQNFDQNLRDTYSQQLGDQGLSARFDNWYTLEAAKQKAKVVGAAYNQMTTDSQNETNNLISTAVRQGNGGRVDSVIENAQKNMLFGPNAEAYDAMRQKAHHQIDLNSTFNQATNMNIADATNLINGNDNLSPDEKVQLLQRAGVVIDQKQKKKWETNYVDMSNQILNGTLHPTYDDLEASYNGDNISKPLYDELIRMRKVMDAAAAGSGSTSQKPNATYQNTYLQLRTSYEQGKPVPYGLPGAENLGGQMLSNTNLQEYLNKFSPVLTTSFSNSELGKLKNDYPKIVLDGESRINAAADKAAKDGKPWTEEQRSLAIGRYWQYMQSTSDHTPENVAKQVAAITAGVVPEAPGNYRTSNGTVTGYTKGQMEPYIAMMANGRFTSYAADSKDKNAVMDTAKRLYEPLAQDYFNVSPDKIESRTMENGLPIYRVSTPKGDQMVTVIPQHFDPKKPQGQRYSGGVVLAHGDALNNLVPFEDQRTFVQIDSERLELIRKQNELYDRTSELPRMVSKNIIDPVQAQMQKRVLRGTIAEYQRTIDADLKALRERGADF